MTRWAALCVVLALAGCTDTTQLPADQRPETPPVTRPAAPATSTGPVRPDFDYAPPATTSGELSLRTFPVPVELGRRWSYAPKPVAARDVNDLIKQSLPEGCSRQNPVLLPHSALEVRYRYGDLPVTAYQVDFASPALARVFFSGRILDLEACREKSDAGAEPLVGQIVSAADGIVLADLLPEQHGPRATELAILTDSSVVLLRASVGLGSAPFGSATTLGLAEKFREHAV